MKKPGARSKETSRRRRPTRPVKGENPRAAAATPPAVNTALSRAVGDVQDIGRDLGTAGRTLAKGTWRLAYDVGALVGLAGKNALDGTAALASSFLRSAETLASTPAPRKPAARASSRRSAARAGSRASSTA